MFLLFLLFLLTGCSTTISSANNSFYNLLSSDIITVNISVNYRIKPYKEKEEKWYYVSYKGEKPGDCDDYAVTKLIELLKLGFERQHLRLATVLTEKNEHHLVLLVQSSNLWFILDNRFDTIVQVDNSNYKFLLIENPEKGEWFYAGKYFYPALSGLTAIYPAPSGFKEWCNDNKNDISCVNYFINYGI